VYSSQEDEFKNDINNFDIKKIFGKIVDKIRTDTINKELTENLYKVNNNELTINVTLKEKFENKFKCIKILNEKSENSLFKEYFIPIQNSEFIINDSINEQIKIKISCQTDKNFKQISDFDLLCIKKISLSQYLYGGKIKIYHLDGELIWFDFASCLEKKPIFILENKGLPKYDLNDSKTNGDLFIYLTIEGVNSIDEDDIAQKYTKTIEETIKLMFPPIEN
jgi:DnaJ-class molecular chaperone